MIKITDDLPPKVKPTINISAWGCYLDKKLIEHQRATGEGKVMFWRCPQLKMTPEEPYVLQTVFEGFERKRVSNRSYPSHPWGGLTDVIFPALASA